MGTPHLLKPMTPPDPRGNPPPFFGKPADDVYKEFAEQSVLAEPDVKRKVGKAPELALPYQGATPLAKRSMLAPYGRSQGYSEAEMDAYLTGAMDTRNAAPISEEVQYGRGWWDGAACGALLGASLGFAAGLLGYAWFI